jgi:hypothetical protein
VHSGELRADTGGALHGIGTLRVSVDLIPNRRFIIYLLDFPSRLLTDRLVHAAFGVGWLGLAQQKIDSDPDTSCCGNAFGVMRAMLPEHQTLSYSLH